MKKKIFSELKVYRFFLMWGGVLLSLFLADLIQYLIDPSGTWWDSYKYADWIDNLLWLLAGSLIYGGIFIIIGYISKVVEWMLASNDSLAARFVTTTAAVIIAMIVLINTEDMFISLIWGEDMENVTLEKETAYRGYVVINVVVAVFINSFYHAILFYNRMQQALIESHQLSSLSHELRETALKAELEMFKLQLDPHFIFNNFSMLTHLIHTDQKGALEFIANLSKVYRYVIANSKKDLIALNEEIAFVQHYFHLIKLRYGASVNLSIDVSASDMNKGIPPVTLQLLIENAIKHNKATISEPLKMEIASRGDAVLEVRNNMQRIDIESFYPGVGLINIGERYRLLGGKIPQRIEMDGRFSVRLELLNKLTIRNEMYNN